MTKLPHVDDNLYVVAMHPGLVCALRIDRRVAATCVA